MMSDETTTPGDCPIETAIPEGHVIFLLGAGASKDAGFPLVDELTCKMRKRLSYVTDMNGNVREEFPELFDAVADHDPKARKNYERFFACLELMIPRPEKPSQNLICFNLEKRLVQAAPYLAASIREPIFNILRERHQGEHYQPDYLAKLGGFVPKEGRLKVFTLNYDLCVENACTRQGINVTTGFCRETGEWTAGLFHCRRPGINLYKLHSSLNWTQRSGEPGICFEIYPPEWDKWDGRPLPELVLGPGSKLQPDDPFVTLYSEFHRAVRQAKVCVAIGCSFEDKHIRQPVYEANYSGRMAVIEVNPSIPKKNFGYGAGAEIHREIKTGAKEALKKCEIWKAVRFFLSTQSPD